MKIDNLTMSVAEYPGERGAERTTGVISDARKDARDTEKRGEKTEKKPAY